MRLRPWRLVEFRRTSRTSRAPRSKRARLAGRSIGRNARAPLRSRRRVSREPRARRGASALLRRAHARLRRGPAGHARRIENARPAACGRRSSPVETGPECPPGCKRAESLGIRQGVGASRAWLVGDYCPGAPERNRAPMCAGVAHPTGLHLSSLLHATL